MSGSAVRPEGTGCFFEDVVVGAAFTSGRRRVTNADIRAFAELSGDLHPLHTEETFCRAQGFPGLLAHGLLGLSLMGGLKAGLGLYAESASVSLGWDRVQFRKPIVAGDELRVQVVFLEKTMTSDGRRGRVRQRVSLVNQRGETVTEAEHLALVRLRAQPESP